MNIPDQHISIAEAKTALAQMLLIEPGVDQDVSAFLLDGQLYRLHIERVTDADEIKELIDEYR